jgi:hypothetical protein
MKKYVYILLAIFVSACSIDRAQEVGMLSAFSERTTDGTVVTIFRDLDGDNILDDGEEVVTQFFIEDGKDGLTGPRGPQGPQGDPGSEGPAGPSGQDAPQLRVTTITLDNGDNEVTFYLDIDGSESLTEGDEIVNVFVIPKGAPGNDGQDGQDGEDGEDGQDGQDGQDGVSPIITYTIIERGEVYNETYYEFGGVLVTIIIGDEVVEFVLVNGADGQPGEPGEDGVCVCEEFPDDCDDEDSEKVALCHKQEKDKKDDNGNDEDDDFITIYVAPSAVQAHLNHGDTVGECED